MKLLKTVIIMLAFVILLGFTVSAAPPETMWPSDSGNTADLIVITKPPKDRSATFDRSYVISGYGKEGTSVAIYKLSGDVFKLTEYKWQIGASGFFAIPIELDKRNNILSVRAEDSNGNYQPVKLEITYLGNNLSDMVKGITVDPGSIPY